MISGDVSKQFDAVGGEALRSKAEEIQKRLDEGHKRNYSPEYLTEIYDSGLSELDAIAAAETEKAEAAIQRHEDELRDVFLSKMKTDISQRLYDRDKFAAELDILNESELQARVDKVMAGEEVFLNEDEGLVFLRAVKDRLPKTFDIIKQKMEIMQWRKPWRRLMDATSRNLEAAVKARKPGEYLIIGDTQVEGVKSAIAVEVKNLLKLPDNKPKTQTERIAGMFDTIKPKSKAAK